MSYQGEPRRDRQFFVWPDAIGLLVPLAALAIYIVWFRIEKAEDAAQHIRPREFTDTFFYVVFAVPAFVLYTPPYMASRLASRFAGAKAIAVATGGAFVGALTIGLVALAAGAHDIAAVTLVWIGYPLFAANIASLALLLARGGRSPR